MLRHGVGSLGRPTIEAIGDAGATALFTARTTGRVLRYGIPFREVVRLVAVLGVRCVGPVLLVVAPMGALMALEGHVIAKLFGVDRLLAPLVALAMAREIAPGFSALMVAMQAGGAIAAELGAMRVRGELDAYKVMGVDPIRHLVAPRLVAGLIVTPVLSLLSLVCGIGAAYLVATHGQGLAGAAFLDNAMSWLSGTDLWGGELKAAIYGLVITAVSCHQGFHAKPGAAGVGLAANKAVLYAIILLPIANYALNSALYSGVGR